MKNKRDAWEKIYKDQGKFFDEIHKDMPKVAKLLKKKELKKILDLGCGTGRHVVYLAKQGFDVYGIDISKTGIKSAKAWAKQENCTPQLVVHDMTKKLPFKNEFFDAIISFQVVHHARIRTIREIIREMERVLKKDGFILITVPKYRKYDPNAGGWKLKKIEDHTYIPLDGIEKGLVHYYFTPSKLRNSFMNFEIKRLYMDYTNHLSIWAHKK